jgi:hypothetical protein
MRQLEGLSFGDSFPWPRVVGEIHISMVAIPAKQIAETLDCLMKRRLY